MDEKGGAKTLRLFLSRRRIAALQPHIHIQRENRVAKFWLEPVMLSKAGGFKPQEINKIGKLVQENQPIFLEKWYEYFGH